MEYVKKMVYEDIIWMVCYKKYTMEWQRISMAGGI